jgi:glucokinase-like ROK family protein
MKHVKTKSERDKLVIEAVVRRFGPLSRVDIRDMTNLRPSTISALVQELLGEDRLREVGRSNNPMGRKQVLLQFNEQYKYVLGIEFDDETVLVTLTDLHPHIKSSLREPAYLTGGSDGLVRQLIECTKKLLRRSKIDVRDLVGLGIADPGLVDTRNGITLTSTTIDFWKNIPLKEIFEKAFGVPVLLESKTRARAIAERVQGVGNMVSDMVYVDYGAGIGAGLILEGRLVRGHGWSAGEFGHTHIVQDGPACNCGSFGCLEALVGAAAVEARVRKAIAEGGRSSVASVEGGAEQITVWDILTAAAEGDKICLAIVEQVQNYLGVGLANLANLFNPSMIVLDQRLALAGPDLLEQITRVIKRQALAQATQDLSVQFAKLGDDAGVLGLALMILERHFEIPALKLPKFMIESGVPVPVHGELAEQVPEAR